MSASGSRGTYDKTAISGNISHEDGPLGRGTPLHTPKAPRRWNWLMPGTNSRQTTLQNQAESTNTRPLDNDTRSSGNSEHLASSLALVNAASQLIGCSPGLLLQTGRAPCVWKTRVALIGICFCGVMAIRPLLRRLWHIPLQCLKVGLMQNVEVIIAAEDCLPEGTTVCALSFGKGVKPTMTSANDSNENGHVAYVVSAESKLLIEITIAPKHGQLLNIIDLQNIRASYGNDACALQNVRGCENSDGMKYKKYVLVDPNDFSSGVLNEPAAFFATQDEKCIELFIEFTCLTKIDGGITIPLKLKKPLHLVLVRQKWSVFVDYYYRAKYFILELYNRVPALVRRFFAWIFAVGDIVLCFF